MIRPRLALLIVALALSGFAGAADAAVRARLGVRPDSLEHCDRGHLAFALWNDAPDTLRVRVHLSLVYQDSIVLGSVSLRTRLGPRDIRAREGGFYVPPRLPSGRYEIRLEAVASDSSRDQASAAFTVLEGGCPSGDPDPIASAAMLAEVAETLGLDQATPATRQTLGAVKRRWDESAGK